MKNKSTDKTSITSDDDYYYVENDLEDDDDTVSSSTPTPSRPLVSSLFWDFNQNQYDHRFDHDDSNANDLSNDESDEDDIKSYVGSFVHSNRRTSMFSKRLTHVVDVHTLDVHSSLSMIESMIGSTDCPSLSSSPTSSVMSSSSSYSFPSLKSLSTERSPFALMGSTLRCAEMRYAVLDNQGHEEKGRKIFLNGEDYNSVCGSDVTESTADLKHHIVNDGHPVDAGNLVCSGRTIRKRTPTFSSMDSNSITKESQFKMLQKGHYLKSPRTIMPLFHRRRNKRKLSFMSTRLRKLNPSPFEQQQTRRWKSCIRLIPSIVTFIIGVLLASLASYRPLLHQKGKSERQYRPSSVDAIVFIATGPVVMSPFLGWSIESVMKNGWDVGPIYIIADDIPAVRTSVGHSLQSGHERISYLQTTVQDTLTPPAEKAKLTKCMLLDILPQHIQKPLYLDSDILIGQPLQSFWDLIDKVWESGYDHMTNTNSITMAMVEDANAFFFGSCENCDTWNTGVMSLHRGQSESCLRDWCDALQSEPIGFRPTDQAALDRVITASSTSSCSNIRPLETRKHVRMMKDLAVTYGYSRYPKTFNHFTGVFRTDKLSKWHRFSYQRNLQQYGRNLYDLFPSPTIKVSSTDYTPTSVKIETNPISDIESLRDHRMEQLWPRIEASNVRDDLSSSPFTSSNTLGVDKNKQEHVNDSVDSFDMDFYLTRWSGEDDINKCLMRNYLRSRSRRTTELISSTTTSMWLMSL